jgi:DnaJ-class molecular chaperone
MLPCNHCHSSGVSTCSECDGLGFVQDVRASGEMEYRACTVCNGKKSARCDRCGGIGWLGADNAVALSLDYGAAAEDLVASCRDGSGAGLAAIERLVGGDW